MPAKLTGRVVALGPSGNLVTDITAEQLRPAPRDESVRVICDEHETYGIFASAAGQPAMTLLAILGSEGTLEITIVGESARQFLGIEVGANVEVVW